MFASDGNCWIGLVAALPVAYPCQHQLSPLLGGTTVWFLTGPTVWGCLGTNVPGGWVTLVNPLLSNPPEGEGRSKGDPGVPILIPVLPSGEGVGGSQESALLPGGVGG